MHSAEWPPNAGDQRFPQTALGGLGNYSFGVVLEAPLPDGWNASKSSLSNHNSQPLAMQ
jgi:hypothetical protein